MSIPDPRIPYGTRCTWWDSIDKVGTFPGTSIPCCPHCTSVLFEVDSIETWNAGADRFEADGHPGYRGMIDWSRGKCFPHMHAMREHYWAATGILVDVSRPDQTPPPSRSTCEPRPTHTYTPPARTKRQLRRDRGRR